MNVNENSNFQVNTRYMNILICNANIFLLFKLHQLQKLLMKNIPSNSIWELKFLPENLTWFKSNYKPTVTHQQRRISSTKHKNWHQPRLTEP